MPLHDWTTGAGWEGVHHSWMTELLRWVKPRLPAGYRAYIGSVPALSIGAGPEKPDLAVRNWPHENTPESVTREPIATGAKPDEEIAVMTLDPANALFVEIPGRLIAAVELISPRNKDRVESRTTYSMRYLAYLYEGVHLLLVDVHRRPLQFSFPDRIAESLEIRQPPFPPPLAVSYRVGPPAATGGHMLSIWRRPLTIGAPLPVVELPIDDNVTVSVDLEDTYMRAAADAYLT